MLSNGLHVNSVGMLIILKFRNRAEVLTAGFFGVGMQSDLPFIYKYLCVLFSL